MPESFVTMCSSRKNTYTPHGRSLEISGGGVIKAKFLEAMYENKLEFPGGRGVQKKNLPWGELIHIFWNCTIGLKHIGNLVTSSIHRTALLELLWVRSNQNNRLQVAFTHAQVQIGSSF